LCQCMAMTASVLVRNAGLQCLGNDAETRPCWESLRASPLKLSGSVVSNAHVGRAIWESIRYSTGLGGRTLSVQDWTGVNHSPPRSHGLFSTALAYRREWPSLYTRSSELRLLPAWLRVPWSPESRASITLIQPRSPCPKSPGGPGAAVSLPPWRYPEHLDIKHLG
jgi:hypothetical protein